MIFLVGSTNPVKVNAVKDASISQWPDAAFKEFEVKSGVSEQPMTDEETLLGSINRSKEALKAGKLVIDTEPDSEVLSVGLEGGIMMINDKMWTTIWATVTDISNQHYSANGGRFLVPQFLADQIQGGEEMGPAISKYFGGRSIKTQEGLVGVVTKNFLDRTQLYSAIAKLAIGQWYGRNWQKQLDIFV